MAPVEQAADSQASERTNSSAMGRPESVELEELTGNETNVALREDVPPDGGYGWIVTACVFLINAHTWGVNSAWGIFLAHYISSSTFAGATQLHYALIGGLSISQSMLVAPLVSWVNAKLGTRASLLLGTILVSASMLASSYATHIWQLFLSQGVCFGYGMGFLYITASAVLPQWFSKRRSLAVGIASSGAGFGGLAYNLGAGAGLEKIGWRWTYIVLAISTAVVNFTCAILLKDRNQNIQPNKRMVNAREFAHVSTCLIILWGWLTELGYVVLLYSLPNYATSIGLSAQQGSIVGAVLNLGLAFGRPVVGYYSDRFGRINMAAAMTALCGVFCLAIWVPAKSYAVLLVFALFSGTVTGTFWGTVVPVTAEVVGIQRLPVAFGMICLPLCLPTTFAESIALQMVSSSGYLSAQIFVGFMYLAGASSVLALRSWKMREIEEDEKREREGRVPIPVGSSRTHDHFWLTLRGVAAPRKV
ncbi:related to MFS transporter (Mch2) [Lecanosticta acicola]|uniref:Related to MFS transporter (Mch2) n=1 Tax=Lecanosticta acicola TaxID=111012 RepID=A0AAI9EB33_9PEZI|nr:related to MFS transporter (Mch2) [Lecanosticta acicola]